MLKRSEPFEEGDWQRVWRAHFRTTRVSDRLVVRPTWEDPAAGQEGKVIVLDPGMAFGTGLHATTRLVLGLIDDLYPDGAEGPARVLDAGTGTGILAIACALLGAARVLALDSDPLAVKAAEENVERNGVGDVVTVTGRDLREVEGPFDLIAANITHAALRGLAPLLTALLDGDGVLLLSGVLTGNQEESLVRCYRGVGLALVGTRNREEWAGLKFSCRGAGGTLESP